VLGRVIRFSVRDSVTVGIFTALGLALGFAVLLALHLLPGALVLVKEALVAFLTAPVMVLLRTKVPRSGLMTVSGMACAVVFCMFGFFTVAVFSVLGGIAGDLIAGRNGYSRLWLNILGYGTFSVAKAFGTYIPFYVWGDGFVRELMARGNVSRDFIDVFVENLRPGPGIVILAVNFVMAGLEVLAGERWLGKHFRPAGLV
jgi:energy-coupling factor transport system substrate-specific component